MTTTPVRPARNVLGEPLVPCSFNPLTGYFRDGCCKTGEDDLGTHVICAVMTAAFLAFSRARGNDLSSPQPAWRFPGLRPGDQWCLCANRWQEAWLADAAPMVVLESTDYSALQIIDFSVLAQFAFRGDEEN